MPKEFDEKKSLFEKAIEHGDLVAMIDLAELCEDKGNLVTAKKIFLEVARFKILKSHIQT